MMILSAVPVAAKADPGTAPWEPRTPMSIVVSSRTNPFRVPLPTRNHAMNHVRSKDVFLVGHPKSGMTWLEFMLAHLLPRGRRNGTTLRDLDRHVPSLAAYGPGDRLKLWPHVLRTSPRLFSTHSLFDPRLTKGRIIYLLRDPRDVIVSHHHAHTSLNPDDAPDLQTFTAQEVGKPDAWSEHVEGWVDNRDIADFCLVRYEQLLADTRTELVRMASFIQLACHDADINRALEAGRFDQMRRKKMAGSWRGELPNDARQIVETAFGPTMRKVGYRLEDTLRKAG